MIFYVTTNFLKPSFCLSSQTLNTGGFPSCFLLTRWMLEMLCLQLRFHSCCVWRTSKTNPGTSGMHTHTHTHIFTFLLHEYKSMQKSSPLLSNWHFFVYMDLVRRNKFTISFPYEHYLWQSSYLWVQCFINTMCWYVSVPLTLLQEMVYRRESTGYKVQSYKWKWDWECNALSSQCCLTDILITFLVLHFVIFAEQLKFTNSHIDGNTYNAYRDDHT